LDWLPILYKGSDFILVSQVIILHKNRNYEVIFIRYLSFVKKRPDFSTYVKIRLFFSILLCIFVKIKIMKVLVKSRVQDFFDINGMDVMSASSIPSVIFDGIEYVSEDSAVDYVYKSSFSLLYKDLLSYAPSIVI
jgi:hypothetical protein